MLNHFAVLHFRGPLQRAASALFNPQKTDSSDNVAAGRNAQEAQQRAIPGGNCVSRMTGHRLVSAAACHTWPLTLGPKVRVICYTARKRL